MNGLARSTKSMFIIMMGPIFIAASLFGDLTPVQGTFHFEIFAEDGVASEALEVAQFLESQYDRATSELQFYPSAPVKLMVYADIEAFHTGVDYPNAPDWAVAAGRVGELRITSPSQPGPAHTKESIYSAALSQYIKALIVEKYPDVSVYWLSLGVSQCIANQEVFMLWVGHLKEHPEHILTIEELEVQSHRDKYYLANAIAYAQMIQKRWGMPTLFKLLENYDAFESILGEPKESLTLTF